MEVVTAVSFRDVGKVARVVIYVYDMVVEKDV
jgi:hypothetical protein